MPTVNYNLPTATSKVALHRFVLGANLVLDLSSHASGSGKRAVYNYTPDGQSLAATIEVTALTTKVGARRAKVKASFPRITTNGDGLVVKTSAIVVEMSVDVPDYVDADVDAAFAALGASFSMFHHTQDGTTGVANTRNLSSMLAGLLNNLSVS